MGIFGAFRDLQWYPRKFPGYLGSKILQGSFMMMFLEGILTWFQGVSRVLYKFCKGLQW